MIPLLPVIYKCIGTWIEVDNGISSSLLKVEVEVEICDKPIPKGQFVGLWSRVCLVYIVVPIPGLG
jgi:hypothetical protein